MTYQVLPKPEEDPTKAVVCSLQNEFGGRARIVVDDHCYVLQLWSAEAMTVSGVDTSDVVAKGAEIRQSHKLGWRSVTHWFAEATKAMHDLVFLFETPDDAARGSHNGTD